MNADSTKIIYASDLLFIVAVFLGKFAVSMLYNRLSCDPTLARAVMVLKIAPCVGCFVSVVLLAVPTSSSPPWSSGEGNATGRVSVDAGRPESISVLTES